MGSQRADVTEQLSTHTLRCKDKFNVYTYDLPSMFMIEVFQWLTLETFVFSLFGITSKGKHLPIKGHFYSSTVYGTS